MSNSRGGDSLAAVASHLGATPGTVAEAASADIVLLAVPWMAVPAALDGLEWDGQILIDATNAFVSFEPMELADLGEETSSEFVDALAPGAHTIKAFNTLFARFIAAEAQRGIVFFAGDDADAKARFGSFADGLGFAPVDIGDLHSGGLLMAAGGGPLSGLHAVRREP
jgi:predicted dinucleotide-binding enzyme